MAFELDFTPEFFVGPYDLEEQAKQPANSVYQALELMDKDDWKLMVKEVFDCDPDYVDINTVMKKIQETNTCRDIRSPVEVYIDEEGYHTILVHDSE